MDGRQKAGQAARLSPAFLPTQLPWGGPTLPWGREKRQALFPGGLAPSNPISSHQAQLGKPEVSTLPSFADEIRDKGIARNFCFALL